MNFCQIHRHFQTKDDVQTQIITITPDDATWILENKNTKNYRTVNHGRVTQYSSDMKNGLWKFSHEAIAFDKRGVLLDGQHRLSAIIDSDKSIKMMVVFNLPESSRDVIDTGASRGPGIVLKNRYSDLKSAGLVAAICRRYHYGMQMSSQRLGNAAILEIYKNSKQPIDFAMELVGRVRVPRLSGSQIMAAFARAWHHESHEKLIAFYMKYVGEVPCTNDIEMTARALERYVLCRPAGGGHSMQEELYAKSCYAIKAYCEDRRVKYLKVTGEIYTLPGK